MRQRSTDDFRRALRAYCKERDLFIEETEGRGPNERIVIFQRVDQKVRRVATIVLRRDQKEISPGFARSLLKRLRLRAEQEIEKDFADTFHRVVIALVAWLAKWFS